MHLVQDAPALLVNWMLHRRMDVAWDDASLGLASLAATSLTLGLVWHIVRMCVVVPEEEDVSSAGAREIAYRSPPRATSPLRRMSTAKYVGLGNSAIIGMPPGQGPYEA